MAKQGEVDVKIRVVDADKAVKQAGEVDKAIDKVGKTAATSGKSLLSLGDILKGAGIAAVAGGVFSLGKAMIEGNAQIETYTATFKTMLGGMDQAKTMMADLKKFGRETPFEFEGLAKNAVLLKNFGTTTEDIIPTLRMLGDVSGGSQEKLDGLALVFAQVQSAGKLQGQDLQQFINQGFNPLNEIAKKTGKSMAELRKEMSDGAISADMVRQAFVDATSEGGQFHNLMLTQSQTFTGLLSNMKDSLGDIIVTLGRPLFDAAKKIIDVINGLLGNEKVQEFLNLVSTLLGKIVGSFGANLMPVITQLIESLLPPLGTLLNIVGNALERSAPLFAKLGPLMGKIAETVDVLLQALAPLIDVFIELSQSYMEDIIFQFELMAEILRALAPLLSLGAKLFAAIMVPALQFVRAVAMPVRDAILDIVRYGGKAMEFIAGIFGGETKEAAVKVKKTEETTATTTSTPPPVTPPPGAPPTDPKKAQAERDRMYKEKLANMKREEELERLQLQRSGATAGELWQLERAFLQRRLALAKKFGQDKQTLADAEHQLAVQAIQREIELNQIRIEAQQRYTDAFKKAKDSEFEAMNRARERRREAERAQDASERAAAGARAGMQSTEFDRIRAVADFEIEENERALQRKLFALQGYEAAQRAAAEEHALYRQKIEADAAQQRRDLEIGMASETFGLLGQMAGEHTAMGKAAALAQALINTHEGATKALSQGGIFGPILAGAVMAFGMSQVQQIMATQVPGRRTGGMMSGPLYQVGEEGPEFAVNARATARNRTLLEAINAGAPANGRAEQPQIPAPANRVYVNIGGKLVVAGRDLELALTRQLDLSASSAF